MKWRAALRKGTSQMRTHLTEPQGKIKNPIIICEDVHKWFDDFHVLKGITTSFEKGERAVICGPSGSGKSTFIRTLNRLEEHQRGTITVDGVELSDDLRNINLIRQEVGMVFQQFNLFPHLTNLQNITLGPIRVRKMTKSEARRDRFIASGTGGYCRSGVQVSRRNFGWATAAGRNRKGIGDGTEDYALR